VLVEAVTAEEQLKDPKTHKWHPFLLIFDRKGNFVRASPLDLSFQIAEIGYLNDRELLVVGSVAADWRQHLAVIDEDGKLLRQLQPGHDDSQYAKDDSLETRLHAINSGAGRAQLVPYRGHVLMLETNSDAPVYELNGGGVIKETRLKLPPGEKIWQIIPSNGRTWDVIFGHADQGSVEDGVPPGLFKPEGVGEFDPETGELLHLVIPGPKHHPASLACEEDGLFTALSTDPKDGSLLVEEATTEK